LKTDVKAITAHYESAGLEKRILDAVTSVAENSRAVSRDLLAAFDEFHIGGRRATRELARFCGLECGWNVLDAGCGVGGGCRCVWLSGRRSCCTPPTGWRTGRSARR